MQVLTQDHQFDSKRKFKKKFNTIKIKDFEMLAKGLPSK
jgi:hypothetical protein